MDFVSQMCRWGMLMGLTGVICGFLGPLYFVPWASTAPILGIVVMGTLCTLFGLIMGGGGWAARQYIS